MSEQDQNIEPETPVELLPLRTPSSTIHLVTSPGELDDVVSQLSKSTGPIAVDAERASGYKYSQRAYLIQLKSADSDIFLIDPITDTNLLGCKAFEDLRKLLSEREWILHAATQDIPCLQELKLYPEKIFDTELAGRLTGQPRVGLGSLVESLLGIALAKEHSAADWSTRPLPESWLNYAALDVELLHTLRSSMQQLLGEQGKTHWAEQEFQSLLSFKQKPQRPDRWRGITGLSKVTDQFSLELARGLWMAREDLAIKMDVSPGRLIPDASILSAATTKPRSKPELASLKTFSGRASRSYLDYWWQAIQLAYKATELPTLRPEKSNGIPNHRNWAAKFPEADLRLRHAKTALTELSEKVSVPLENLLTPDILRQICFTPPEPSTAAEIRSKLVEYGARDWQIDLTAELISVAIARSDEPIPKPQILPE